MPEINKEEMKAYIDKIEEFDHVILVCVKHLKVPDDAEVKMTDVRIHGNGLCLDAVQPVFESIIAHSLGHLKDGENN